VAFPRGSTPAVIALGAGWLIAMPTLIAIAQRFERRRITSSTGNPAHVA
jgi:hypothetical protein